METRFVAYNRLGSVRGLVPNPLEAIIGKSFNDLTTLSLHYDRQSINSGFLDDEPEISIEVLGRDGLWKEIRDGRVRCLTVDFDHLEEMPTRRYDFLHIGEGLKGALVYAPYGQPLNDEGRVSFPNATVGKVIDHVWANANLRGWQGFVNDFTATHDSAGQLWDKTFTISYSVETNLLTILNSFIAMGVVDVAWEGRKLRLFNKGTITPNLSTGAAPLKFLGTGGASGVDAAPERQDMSSLATHLIVLGENGLRWEFPTGASVAEGRREIVQTYSGVNDLQTAQILVAPILLKAQNHLKNTTRQFHITPETKYLPFIDYDTGAWVDTQRGTDIESLQIVALNLQINQNGSQGYVTLGDKIDDLLQTMYQRIQGLTGGVANEGAGKPPIANETTPTPAFGLSIDVSAYIDETGKAVGMANIAWDHTGKDVSGNTIAIQEYRVWYRQAGTNHRWEPAFVTEEKSGIASPLQIYTPNKDLITWEFMVQTVSRKGLISAWSAIVPKLMEPDAVAPFKPTTPSVSVWLRSPYIKWDGKGLNGANPVAMPFDFSHLIVWEATDAQMTDKIEVARFDSANNLAINLDERPADVTRWYALQAYDYTGNASPLSDVASMTPTDAVNEQSINDALDAMSGDIQIAQSTADGKTTISANAPVAGDLTGKPAGATWTRVQNGKVVGAWYKEAAGSTSWTAMPFDPVMIPQINIGTGTFGDLDGIRLAASSVKAEKMFVGSYRNQVPNGNGDKGVGWGAFPLNTTVLPPGVSVAGSFHAIPTQRTGQNHGELWPIDRTRSQQISAWAYADVADSRWYLEILFYDRAKSKIGTAQYVVSNQVVPTTWTKFSAIFAPVATPGAQVTPSNAVYATMRLFPNHTNGTAVANQYFAGITMREMEAGELIVDGSVKARHVGAGEITADKLEAVLALVNRIVAGPVGGTHAELDGNGFHAYAEDPTDGIPNEVIRMGVASSGDFLSIMGSNAEISAAISQEGVGSFRELNAMNALYYKGRELDTILSAFPRGQVTYGEYLGGTIGGITTSAGSGIIEISFTAMPGRAYRLTGYVRGYMTGGNGQMNLQLIPTMNGSSPTLANSALFVDGHDSNQDAWNRFRFDQLIHLGNNVPLTTRILLSSGRERGPGTWNILNGRIEVDDVGIVRNNSAITNLGQGTGTAPITTYTKTYVCNNSMNYQGSNAQYPFDPGHMYQGLSPAGYGNLKSIGLFPDMTADLAGATINYIRVYFNFSHWYYNSGGTARIGVHTHSVIPGTYSQSGTIITSGGWPKPGARWIDVDPAHWASFKNGTYKGLSLEGDSTYGTYGYADRPTIEINYYK